MAWLQSVDASDLHEWLTHVERKESAQWLMVAIAYKRGVSVDELADWYDIDERAITDWFEEVDSVSLVTAIAEKEGVELDELASRYGLSISTIRAWFRELEDLPVEDAIDLIRRYSQERDVPVFRHTQSRVHFLDYEAIREHGWSIEDDDLFEKASAADLKPSWYGRFSVEPGETILEAAETRGFSWPYACRAGACANCAVLVKEGDIVMPGNNVLSDHQIDVMNARLTCVGVPVTEDVKLIMNIQHLDQFQNLRLPSPLGETGPSVSP